MARWSLSATQAGWLVGAFFAAYVVMVPILLALTDRYPARRVYLLGTGLTTLAHLGFALLADGFWSTLTFRVLAGVGPRSRAAPAGGAARARRRRARAPARPTAARGGARRAPGRAGAPPARA